MTEARAFLDGHASPQRLPAVMGRPSGYNETVVAAICEAMADPDTTLRDIAKIEGFPGKSTIFRWLREHPEFAIEYAYALEWRTEQMVDDIIGIADDSSKDHKIEVGEPGSAVVITVDKENIARSKLRINERWRIAGKRMPHKYGEVAPVVQLQPPPPNGDGARLVNPAGPVYGDNDPVKAQLEAFRKVIEGKPAV